MYVVVTCYIPPNSFDDLSLFCLLTSKIITTMRKVITVTEKVRTTAMLPPTITGIFMVSGVVGNTLPLVVHIPPARCKLGEDVCVLCKKAV